MKVVVVSGIWPPDVGGPASHAPELADYLVGRGHDVHAVVTADHAPAREAYPVHWVPRRLPVGVRHVRVVSVVRRLAAAADVVYATTMLERAALGAAAARRPLVAKLVADNAYERARRWNLFSGDLDAFQRFRGDLRVRALRRARDLALRRADRLICPSAYLAGLAVSWGVPGERVTVLPNPAPVVPEMPSRDELRRRLGVEHATLAFAGRLTRQKALDVALEALRRADGVTLLVAGDGPEAPALARLVATAGLDGRVRFLGPQSRQGVLELFRAADAILLPSAWENFPHTVVEALAVGTPVIATAVGGVGEVVRDGENGILVPPGDPAALAAAIKRFFVDEQLRRRLAGAARASVASYTPERSLRAIEQILARAVAGS